VDAEKIPHLSFVPVNRRQGWGNCWVARVCGVNSRSQARRRPVPGKKDHVNSEFAAFRPLVRAEEREDPRTLDSPALALKPELIRCRGHCTGGRLFSAGHGSPSALAAWRNMLANGGGTMRPISATAMSGGPKSADRQRCSPREMPAGASPNTKRLM
jgi:hypothetical protein